MTIQELRETFIRAQRMKEDITNLEKKATRIFIEQSNYPSEELLLLDIARNISRITAISTMRDRSGKSLVECRDTVDSIIHSHFQEQGN